MRRGGVWRTEQGVACSTCTECAYALRGHERHSRHGLLLPRGACSSEAVDRSLPTATRRPHLTPWPRRAPARSIDEEEEQHVKLALRQTLDAQVERKRAALKQAKADELEQQQHALNCVALEMQEKRTRDFVQKEEQKVTFAQCVVL